MKKIKLVLVAICVLLFAACTPSKSNSPKDVVTTYLECIKSGNFEKAVNCFYFKEELQQTQLKALAAKLEEGYNKEGGLTKFEIVSEDIEKDEDGNIIKGIVKVKMFYKDGKEEEETLNTVLNDGEWKIDFTIK